VTTLEESENRPSESPGSLSPAEAEELGTLFGTVVGSVRTVLYANERTVQLAVGCLLAEGHLLIEDLPGLGKTTLAKALAHSLGLGFRRVQFTADLLPADVTGAMALNRSSGEPTFRPGPIFTNVLMADELNRASARAQSALLEAMEERHVSADGETMALPRPFMVLATQNPFDAAGTSPLPHGQRDRFLIRLSLGYPSRAEEDRLLARTGAGSPFELSAAVTGSQVGSLMAGVAAVHVSAAARGYILDLVAVSRAHPAVSVGASPRAALSLVRAASALALASGRHFAVPSDIQQVLGPVLGHRLLLNSGSEASGTGIDEVIGDLIHQVRLPERRTGAGPRSGD
jgi:MoxR-like ATPase